MSGSVRFPERARPDFFGETATPPATRRRPPRPLISAAALGADGALGAKGPVGCAGGRERAYGVTWVTWYRRAVGLLWAVRMAPVAWSKWL